MGLPVFRESGVDANNATTELRKSRRNGSTQVEVRHFPAIARGVGRPAPANAICHSLVKH